MFRACLAILPFALVAASGAQAGPREENEAKAALNLALALQRSAPAPIAHKRPSYAEAYHVALKSGKPLVIHVAGFDCRDACKECLAKGDCQTCNADEVGGDSSPRMILAYPANGKLYYAREWRNVPTESSLRSELSRLRFVQQLDCPPGY